MYLGDKKPASRRLSNCTIKTERLCQGHWSYSNVRIRQKRTIDVVQRSLEKTTAPLQTQQKGDDNVLL